MAATEPDVPLNDPPRPTAGLLGVVVDELELALVDVALPQAASIEAEATTSATAETRAGVQPEMVIIFFSVFLLCVLLAHAESRLYSLRNASMGAIRAARVAG